MSQLKDIVLAMDQNGITYDEAVRTFQRLYLVRILNRHNGRIVRAAAEMGIHRNTLRRILAQLDISLRNGHEGDAA